LALAVKANVFTNSLGTKQFAVRKVMWLCSYTLSTD